MDLGVRDQGYLVVGGTAGMGFEAARALAADGARIVVCGRDDARARAAADAIAAEHSVQVVPVVGDVTKGVDEAERVVAEATAALGDLAGMAVTTGLSGHHTLEDATDAIWEDAVQDVLMSVVRTVKAVLPQLVARGSGTIVTTSAYSIHAPHANRMPYVALKGAVAVFTKNVAKSYGRAGVRANCVCPGAIETAGLAALRTQLATARGVPEEGVLEQVMVDEWHMDVALGRPGRPEEVGELFAFLLSPRAGYLTGATINIDGGTDF
jgi:NAD(P)-dependent dehydrogenase (short-subunit alcohol dehydrogenase family)